MYGFSRQAYYQHFWRDAERQEYQDWLIKLVKKIRCYLPYSGGNNLWRLVQRFLRLFSLPPIGRDRFAELLSRSGLKVRYAKHRGVRTTYSNHQYVVQPNLLKDLNATEPGQVVVADITYVHCKNRHGYLFLATDAYTRLIVGYHFSKNLSHQGAVSALEMIADNLSRTNGIIHHTDRGTQYCCHSFIDKIKSLGMKSSMTDADHAAQNALAECMNGILKREFGLHRTFQSFAEAEKAVDEAIFLYNHLRIHGKLKGRTPAEAHFHNYNFFNNWASQLLNSIPTCPAKV